MKTYLIRLFAVFLLPLISLNASFAIVEGVSPEVTPTESLQDAIVIGGGWSGLMAACRLKQKGIKVILLEKRDQIGGIFKFSKDPNILTVMETTELTSSRHVTQISNYPYPPEYPDFPSHWQIAEYL